MDFKYTAIIIEPRKYKSLEFVLNNILDCLDNSWKVILFHGINNEEYCTIIKNKLNNDRLFTIKLNIVNLNQKTYSELLATKYVIYDNIDTEYFLIFQTDSMILKQNIYLLDKFLNNDYDYIGAPWLKTAYIPTKERDYIGNGGFSLRKKSKMIQIIKNHKWDENNEWHEDLFFSKKYKDIEIKKPEYEIAKLFCVDEVFSPITLACHKPWFHHHYNELIKIYPEIETLKSLQSEI